MHDYSLSSSLDDYISDYSISDNSIDKTLKNRLVNIHNEEIWEKCFELYKTRNDSYESFCFKCCTTKKIDIETLYNLFILFNNIHVYTIKSKIWLNILNQFKAE